ncbi:GNAT family N-acetyltransferase [Peribacillus sp. SCS-37]|uniref:GNAT family N-acetyltransferase n=1 Tax=Paraperibacillus esterisolvens TaxID=3115296 RepID=UPI0039064C2A
MFIHKIDDELSLKVLEERDGEKLFALTDRSRSYLKEWLPWLDYTRSVEDSREFIRMTRQGLAENRSLTTGILYKGQMAGAASFHHFDWTHRTTSMGYWLGQEFQGKGIMTRVAAALIQYAFEELGLNRVEIRAAYGNLKSRAIPERLGFMEEGRIRQAEWLYDHFVDHAVYGLLSEDWKRRKSAEPGMLK